MDVSKRQIDLSSPADLVVDADRKVVRRAPPDAWDLEARQVVKAAMKLRNFSYKSLAATLARSGVVDMTPQALALRINRGSFSFGFALQVLLAMGVSSVDISHVKLHKAPVERRIT